MELDARLFRESRFASLLTQPVTTRLLATVGIVVMTVGLDAQCAVSVLLIRGQVLPDNSWTIRDWVYGPLATAGVMRWPVLLLLGVEVVYSVLTWGGLALIPLLWRSLSPNGAIVLRRLYALWLALLTLLALAGLPSLHQFMSQPPQDLSPYPVTLQGSTLVPGVAVFPLGVLLGAAALFLLLREPLPMTAPALPARTGWLWAATLALTLGCLVWCIGFYFMPEATTSACPPVIFSVTQFAHGACAGLDSDQVRQAAYYAGLNPIALFFYGVSWNFELLVAAAGVTALAGWTRQLSVWTLAWLTVWPAVALGVALVALHGANLVAQHGFHLAAATSAWHVGPGMIVTFVGLGLVALGQFGLWQEMARARSAARTGEMLAQIHHVDVDILDR